MFFALRVTAVIFLIFSGGCSYLNKKEVVVLVSSNPIDAKIYIGDQYYGDTPKEIELIPSKDYNILLKKDGYIPSSFMLESEYSLRKSARYDGNDKRRCALDAIGSIFVVPYFALKSVYCRNFTRNKYFIELVEAPQRPIENNHPSQTSRPYVRPFLDRNYYFSPSDIINNADRQPEESREESFVGNQRNPYPTVQNLMDKAKSFSGSGSRS